ncbi:uncharacterized protein LOC106050470 [Biomphalaria glabrata]|uniref:Carbonic anhydrase n=1 Tax=Biomphalaria glabrata TaxID=6526 RepID=A0A9W2YF48_BIOGL|nr:uncharacterized protein LOC106050470 [Biomphalaria glabrata]
MCWVKVIAVLSACLFITVHSAEWTYKGDHGDDHWPELFDKCAQRHQSPINIYEGDLTIDSQLLPFRFSNYDALVDMVLSNNGHSAVVTLGPTVPVAISGGGLTNTYNAVQFHFHWGETSVDGSEHLISSAAYPMELHIVHYNSKYPDFSTASVQPDGLAVLGFMFEVSSTNNKNLDDIVNNLVNVMTVGTSVSLGAGTLSSILPPSFSKFYRYPGSLTTPGCDESVTWTVFKETIQISELQLQVFRSLTDSHNELLSENHRGVQPINDRVVVANFDPHIHWSYHATSEWSDLYEACSAENQSPINIETNLTQADEKLQVLTFKNYDGSSPVTMKLKNTGHAAQVDFSGAEISVSNGGLPDEYVASQLHFHWGSHDLIGSEHLIDDHSYPMELHIVHYKKSLGSLAAAATEAEGLAVLGIFFQISSNDNPALNSIIQNLGSIQMPDTSVEIPTFSLNSILPANRVDFYRYEGSLTTPRCLESVIWTVFKDSVPISSAQLDKFRNIRSSERDQNGQNIALVDNTRHVQYLNGRVVLRNFNLPPPDNYWSYKGSHGPSSWAHDYPLCGDRYTGRQSPVNIDTTKVLFNVLNSIPLRLDGYNASSGYTLTMRNTGHSVQIDIDGNLRVSRGGLSLTYRATQVHFHWGSDSTRGSEHTIDGRSYPMEIHIVHYNIKYPSFEVASVESKGLAVLAVLVEVTTQPNVRLNFVFDSLAKVSQPGSSALLDVVAFPFLPSDTSSFFRYEGSLTTPGCYETVTWTLFRETIKVSEDQIAKLRTLQQIDHSTNLPTPMVDNNRPVQPLNGRTVTSTFWF